MGVLGVPEPVPAMRLLVQASLLLEPARPSVLWFFVVLAHGALRLPLWARPPHAPPGLPYAGCPNTQGQVHPRPAAGDNTAVRCKALWELQMLLLLLSVISWHVPHVGGFTAYPKQAAAPGL